MSKLVLYHFPNVCSSVAMTALEEAGLEYEARLVNIMTGEQKSPEYLQIHPGGKVPALQVDDRVLTENVALLWFIHGLCPQAKLLPTLTSLLDQAQVHADLLWVSGTIHPVVRQLRMPVRFTTGDDLQGVRARGQEYLHSIMLQINERLADNRWWYGEHWSVMDVYLAWCCMIAVSANWPLADYANLPGFMQRLQARNSVQRAAAKQAKVAKMHGIAFPN